MPILRRSSGYGDLYIQVIIPEVPVSLNKRTKRATYRSLEELENDKTQVHLLKTFFEKAKKFWKN